MNESFWFYKIYIYIYESTLLFYLPIIFYYNEEVKHTSKIIINNLIEVELSQFLSKVCIIESVNFYPLQCNDCTHIHVLMRAVYGSHTN